MKYKPLLIFALVFFPFCGNNKKPSKEGPTAKGSMQGALKVDAVVVKQTPLNHEITLPGILLPAEMVDLKTENGGKIIELNIDEGKRVKKNNLLARINDNEARASLSKLEVELKLATEELDRKTQLKEKGVISQQDHDLAVSKVAALKADIRKITAQIEKSEIRAPFDGTLGLRHVSLGEVVTPSTVFASLVQDDNLKLEFSVPERYAQHIKKGQKVVFTSGTSNSKYSASIFAHDPIIDETTRSLKVRAVVSNRNKVLLPGSFASVHLNLSGSDKTTVLPPQSLIPVLGGQSVVVSRGGKAIFQSVRTGARTATEVEVISGLNHGDTVLITGLLQVRKGMPLSVSIVE